MKKRRPKFFFIICCFIGFFSNELSGQLGFCDGNSGTPIFTEDFGTGLTDGPALPAGTTTYFFTDGIPLDGQYTLSSTTNYFDWANVLDHTPGDNNGKSLIVNASFTAGEFYSRTVNGLCEDTTYEFSSWLLNLTSANPGCGIGIPINVRFQIWDETDTTLLAQGDTGEIANNDNPDWEQYALVFSTQPGQTSVILKIRNNANGGCGNDLAIDDISFSSCGDAIGITNNENGTGIITCAEEGGITTTLEATPNGAIFRSYFYQWQQSTDGVLWTDIPGENNNAYTTPTLTSTAYFRAKVAENAVNLPNDLCNVLSDVFEIRIIPTPLPPVSNGDISNCENQNLPLTVSVLDGTKVNWYDAPTGGALLLEDSLSYTPTTSGTYYAESVSGSIDCESAARTPLTYTINQKPQVNNETIELCDGNSILLSADSENMTYVWNTGETTELISITTPGEYTVTVTNPEGCSTMKTISVNPVTLPVISTIKSDGLNILIELDNEGQFEFALDGGPFQESPVLELVEGGNYTVNISYGDNCGIVSQEYIHVVIPKFFTPNADGNNDLFLPEGLEFLTSYKLSIFNRFGQLLQNTDPNNSSWDGTFNGAEMPADTYWYQLQIEGTIRNGYFALKR